VFREQEEALVAMLLGTAILIGMAERALAHCAEEARIRSKRRFWPEGCGPLPLGFA